MRRTIGGAVIIGTVLVLLMGCRTTKSSVALFSYNQQDPFIDSFVVQIRQTLPERISIDVFDARNSQVLQNEQLDAAFRHGYDVFIVNPVDRLAAYTITRRAHHERIPVVFFNREPLWEDLIEWEQFYYVGARAAQSAQLQASLVMDLFGTDPYGMGSLDKNGDQRVQTILLKGEQGHQDAEIRTTELLRTLDDAGFAIELLTTEVCDWDRNVAYTRAEELIDQYGDTMELIVSNNDAMALGMISRLRQEGFFADTNGNGRVDRGDERWIPIVGIDGIAAAREWIKEGYLYGTVKNDSETMAGAIVELTLSIIEDTPRSKLSYPPRNGHYIWVDYRPLTVQKR